MPRTYLTMRKHLWAPAIEVLEKLGYIYIPSEKAELEEIYITLLTDILKEKLIEFNEYQYKGRTINSAQKHRTGYKRFRRTLNRRVGTDK